MKKQIVILLLLIIIIMIIFSNYKKLEFIEQVDRYPSCIKSDKIALKVFHLLERNGMLDQTKLIDVYNLLICLYQELKKYNCTQTLVTKYNNQLDKLGYIKSDLVNAKIKLFIINNNIDLSGLSYQMEYIIIGCIYMIEYSSNQLGLFPDDAVELSNINISFYNKYINEIKKLDNC